MDVIFVVSTPLLKLTIKLKGVLGVVYFWVEESKGSHIVY